ncbi:CBS domain-containing protein [Desertibaculum subflavum]|uniref:CBS domain-containing protein n=1 Tax=Desertibaculum subflavum TaxID=2268458 RepID=UPI000E66C093
MRIAEIMSREVRLARPTDTVQHAARLMAEIEAGALPVGEGDRLVGMLTDRDIAVRAVAAGRGPDCPVAEVMTRDVKYVYEDETIDDLARNIAMLQVRRLPVLSRDKRLVGIVSLSDLAATPVIEPARDDRKVS